MLNINRNYLNGSCRWGYANNPEYIVVHYTGNKNKDTALNNVKYISGLGGDASGSAHYYIDDNECYQLLEDTWDSWSVGDDNGYGRFAFGITNTNQISIEMCCTAGNYYVSDKTQKNCAMLVAYLLKKHGLGLDRIRRHYDASRKDCPAGWHNGYTSSYAPNAGGDSRFGVFCGWVKEAYEGKDFNSVVSEAPKTNTCFENADQSLYNSKIGIQLGCEVVISPGAKIGNGCVGQTGNGLPAPWVFPNKLVVQGHAINSGSEEVLVKGVWIPTFAHYVKVVNNTKINYPIKLDDANPTFSETYYINKNEDLKKAKAEGRIYSGWSHYCAFGKNEESRKGKIVPQKPSDWDDKMYLELNPDVKNAGYTSGWSHYCAFGWNEGRAYKKEDIKAEITDGDIKESSLKYQVVSGSFTSKENAEKQLAILAEKGINAFIQIKK